MKTPLCDESRGGYCRLKRDPNPTAKRSCAVRSCARYHRATMLDFEIAYLSNTYARLKLKHTAAKLLDLVRLCERLLFGDHAIQQLIH